MDREQKREAEGRLKTRLAETLKRHFKKQPH